MLLRGEAFFCLALGLANTVSAQTVASVSAAAAVTGSPALSTLLQAFQAEQQALGTELQNLLAQGATPDQIEAWQQQNGARLAAQQQRAQAISAAQVPQPIAYVTDVEVPEGASQTMEDFLEARANLFNLRAQLHNQALASAGSVDEAQVAATFAQQNGAALQAQVQRAQVLAAESDAQPQPVPPPLSLPANASPALQAFLTLRDQLMRAQVQLHNQNLTLTPAARQAALTQWQQQNAGQLQQLQQRAQNLSAATSTQN